MESKKSVVSSFDVDHITLREGLYLRSVYTINDELAVHSWDMRFCAPMDHAPLGSGEVHTIEHLMAYHLRLDPVIGKSIVSFCPMGCKTGFYLSTMNDVDAELNDTVTLLPSTVAGVAPKDACNAAAYVALLHANSILAIALSHSTISSELL